MIEEIEVRKSLPNDIAAIEKLYPDAFPDEELRPLVRDLHTEESIVLSLAAIIDRKLVGHIIFTTCSISGRTEAVSLLGPLAVAPAWQRQGIGRTLIRAGFHRLKNADVNQVYVLGDPAYYERVGFKPEADVSPPYPLPEEWRGAWQSLSLSNAEPPLRGQLSVPRPWCQPALWAP